MPYLIRDTTHGTLLTTPSGQSWLCGSWDEAQERMLDMIDTAAAQAAGQRYADTHPPVNPAYA